ncbi:MAG TPA: glycosyltransferase family 2 protein, partial [Verrucomicrobiae bacterium]
VRHVNVPFEGFGKLRNTALGLLKHDWVVSIDADERSTPAFAAEVRGILEAGPKFAAYHVPRHSHFLGKHIRYSGWYPDYRQPQFFNRTKLCYADDLVHEGYKLDGELGYLSSPIPQYPWNTIEIAVGKMQRYSTLMARRYQQQGKQAGLAKLLLNPIFMFFRIYLLKQGWRDGRHGLILAAIYAYYTFLKYSKLWELQKAAIPQPSAVPAAQPLARPLNA